MPVNSTIGGLGLVLQSLRARLPRFTNSSPRTESVSYLALLACAEQSSLKASAEIRSCYARSMELLGPLAAGSDTLLAACDRLLLLAVGKSEGDFVVDGTTAILKTPFEFLDFWVVQVHDHARHLVASQTLFARLQSSESQLKSVVTPLTHIQTMFRIESARLPEDVRDVFANLTAQIASVHEEVTSTFSEQFRIICQTLLTLEEVRGRLQRHADALQSGLAGRQRDMSTSVAKLKSELARNENRDTELGVTSRAIADAIHRISAGLRSDTAMAEQLAEVRVCLAQARLLLTEPHTPPASESPLPDAAALLKAQGDRLRQMQAHLDGNEQALEQALHQIETKTTTLNHSCILLHEFEDITVASHGSVELSLELMDDALSFLSSVVDLSREFQALVAPLGKLTSNLTGALERLSSEMRLIALNAQVQAVHIGSGTGLEVLAAHTADVSTQTSALAETVTSDIGHLVRLVEALLSSFDHGASAGAQTLATLTVESASHKARLHSLRDQSLSELRSVGNAIDAIKSATDAITAQSDARQGAIEALLSLSHDLGRVHDQLIPVGAARCTAPEHSLEDAAVAEPALPLPAQAEECPPSPESQDEPAAPEMAEDESLAVLS